VVVDVMTPEDYEVCHIAGARNACVYEMVFLDRVAEYAPDRESSLVLYDTSGTTRAAAEAQDRLIQAGYRNVSVLEGGLSAWRSAELPLEGTQIGAYESGLRDGAYRIDTEKSMFEWIGRNLNNRHYGRIAIKEGSLTIREGTPAKGNIVLDMERITNIDLQDQGWRDMLIHHLRSPDFFAVELFPEASFRLTGWETGNNAPPEAPDGRATGELTIRDVTRTVSFQATIAPQADGSIKAHAAFDIDRTLWNVHYGSGRVFERLGMHLVHDIISLEMFIQAVKPPETL
jgi:polyisoprenoid-binding protein YceI